MIERHGVWKRAGMTGLIAGLDLAEAMATLPDYCDRGRARRLLLRAETGYLAGVIAREETKEKDQDGR